MLPIAEFLAQTAQKISSTDDLSHLSSGESFEKYVVDIMKELANGHKIEQTGKLAFPDIVVDDKYGVEVKFSNSGKWESLGNSIFEGTSVGNLHSIYVLFGKKAGKRIEVRFALYEECLIDVKVTHSPRFIVSLEENREQLFNQLDISYEQFKDLDKHSKGKEIKDYFRKHLKEGQEVWFLDKDETSTSVALRSFSSLEETESNKLLLEAYILFPQVFSSSPTKYAGVATHWITKYQVYNSALRDKFSASGREKIFLPDKGEITVKKIYKNLYRFAVQIKQLLEHPDETLYHLCKEKWELTLGQEIELHPSNLLDTWLKLLDDYGVSPSDEIDDLKPSEIFFAGLESN